MAAHAAWHAAQQAILQGETPTATFDFGAATPAVAPNTEDQDLADFDWGSPADHEPATPAEQELLLAFLTASALETRDPQPQTLPALGAEPDLAGDFDWGEPPVLEDALSPSDDLPVSSPFDLLTQSVAALTGDPGSQHDSDPEALEFPTPATEEQAIEETIAPPMVTPISHPTAKGAASVAMRVDLQRLDKISAQVGELSISRNQMQRQQDLVRQSLDILKRRLKVLRDRSVQLERIGDQLIASGSAAALPQIPTAVDLGQPLDWQAGFDALELDRYSSLNLLIQEVLEESAQIDEVLDDLSLYSQTLDQTLRLHGQGVSELNDELMAVRMMPVGKVLERLPRVARDLAVAQNKQVAIVVQGADVLVDKPVLDQLLTPLVHLVRNAIDHGIEPADERRAQGKPATAQLVITALRQGGQVVIHVRDDGRGIDRTAVKQRAIAQGLCHRNDLGTMDDATLLSFIFTPGFSTARQVSEISGRGVGLDAVQTQLAAIKGTVSVLSTPQRGTTFTLRLPLTLGLTQLILCQVGRHTYAFPVDTVTEIIPVPAGIPSCLWRGQTIPIHPLTTLFEFGLAAARWHRDPGFPVEQQSVLLFERDEQVVAIAVDHLVAQQELAIKPLDPGLTAPPYLYGCTVGATGLLIPVVDGWTLGQQAKPLAASGESVLELAPPSALSPTEIPQTKQHLLVVDDSAMMRQTLARQLEQAGYEISQAKDGHEALAILSQPRPVNLVLCDVEMPRMNGFELLTQRRKTPELASIPVVMLTSRSGQKHRQLALRLGATAYLTKPCLEYELLSVLASILGGIPTPEEQALE
ncbi:MAG: hypothetical protein OHK0012_10830 [Synechococcales cyanobacterium]